MSPRGLVVVALVAAAGLITALALSLDEAGGDLIPGEPAPPFTLETFDGQVINLADQRGKVVVVNFWASWCQQCVFEAPDLQAVADEYRDHVLVVGVDYTDTEPAARAWLDRYGIRYPSGPDKGARISKAYRITGVPETVIVDRHGNVVPLSLRGAEGVWPRVRGPIMAGGSFTPDDLRALLDELIAEAS